MAPNNAYQVYNNSKIMTASPAELTLMLYEGAIKFCNLRSWVLKRKMLRKHTQHYEGGAHHRRISGNTGS